MNVTDVNKMGGFFFTYSQRQWLYIKVYFVQIIKGLITETSAWLLKC